MRIATILLLTTTMLLFACTAQAGAVANSTDIACYSHKYPWGTTEEACLWKGGYEGWNCIGYLKTTYADGNSTEECQQKFLGP